MTIKQMIRLEGRVGKLLISSYVAFAPTILSASLYHFILKQLNSTHLHQHQHEVLLLYQQIPHQLILFHQFLQVSQSVEYSQ